MDQKCSEMDIVFAKSMQGFVDIVLGDPQFLIALSDNMVFLDNLQEVFGGQDLCNLV
jgi:hypothetical protein